MSCAVRAVLARAAAIGLATAGLVADLTCPCGREGTMLCPSCSGSLDVPPRRVDAACDALQVVGEVRWGLDAEGPGIDYTSVLPVLAVGEYQEPLRSIILAWKNRGQYLLTAPVARALEPAVERLLAEDRESRGSAAAAERPVLVPVPSTRAHRLRRGEDHTLLLATRLAASTGGRVHRIGSLPGAGQSGKGARERHRRVRPLRGARVGPDPAGPPVVMIDDVVTTGSTLRGLHDRLQTEGHRVIGAAVLASARMSPPGTPMIGMQDCQDNPIIAWQNE